MLDKGTSPCNQIITKLKSVISQSFVSIGLDQHVIVIYMYLSTECEKMQKSYLINTLIRKRLFI